MKIPYIVAPFGVRMYPYAIQADVLERVRVVECPLICRKTTVSIEITAVNQGPGDC